MTVLRPSKADKAIRTVPTVDDDTEIYHLAALVLAYAAAQEFPQGNNLGWGQDLAYIPRI